MVVKEIKISRRISDIEMVADSHHCSLPFHATSPPPTPRLMRVTPRNMAVPKPYSCGSVSARQLKLPASKQASLTKSVEPRTIPPAKNAEAFLPT